MVFDNLYGDGRKDMIKFVDRCVLKYWMVFDFLLFVKILLNMYIFFFDIVVDMDCIVCIILLVFF